MGNNRNITFYILEIEDFYVSKYSDYYEKIYKIDTERYHNPTLYKIWNEKSFMIEKVLSIEKPNYIYWIDIGCVQEENINFPNFDKLNTDDFKVIKTNPEKYIGTSNIQGGFFGGEINRMKKWIKTYKKVLQYFVDTNVFGGKDQLIMSYINNRLRLNAINYRECDIGKNNKWLLFLHYFGNDKIQRKVSITGTGIETEKLKRLQSNFIESDFDSDYVINLSGDWTINKIINGIFTLENDKFDVVRIDKSSIYKRKILDVFDMDEYDSMIENDFRIK